MTYSSMGEPRLTEEEKNKIVKEYLPQVKIWASRAKSTLPESVDIDEIYSAASLGLIECLDKFDKSRNISFGTYVEHRVKGAILDALRGMDFLSRGARSKLKMVEAAIQELRHKLGRHPAISEIAAHINLDEKDVHSILDLQIVEKHLSLDDTVGDDEGTSLIEYIQANGLTPEEETVRIKLTEQIASEIDKLAEKERLVISLYYYEELTMKEIAGVLEITESRVSQLHSSAVKKMKKRLKDMT